AAAAGRSAGDPFRAALPRAAPPDLGVAARRSRARIRPHRERRRRTVMSAPPLKSQHSAEIGPIGSTADAAEAAIAADVRNSTRRRKTLLWAARIATLVIIIGGW